MTAKLIVRLHQNHLLDWILTDDNHHIMANEYQQASLNMPTLATLPHIILLVPSTDINLLNVKIPKMKRSQLARALPYAIEDRLCEDIEQLHFAAGQWLNNTDILSVAVTSQQKMEQWLAICKANMIEPQLIIPDIFALSYQAEQWTCYLENNLVLIRTGLQTGLAIEIEQAALVLNTLAENEPPNTIHLASIEASLAQTFATTLSPRITKTIATPPQNLLLQALSMNDNTINLLQGHYKTARKKLTLPIDWRLSIQLAIAALILFIVTESVNYWVIKHRNEKLQQQISLLSQSVLPGETIDMNTQPYIERELHLLNQLGKGNAFLTSMDLIGNSLTQYPGLVLMQINYQDNLLTLVIQANNQQNMTAWLNDLRSKHMTIIKTNKPNQTHQTEITIKLKEP